jgi:hypothetical protein
MHLKTITLTSLIALAAFGCSKKEDSASKPVTCEVAGQMVSKRMGEFADEAKVTGDKRVTLDKAMAAAITTRCTEDKWEEVTLGWLGAMASIPEGKLDAPTYRKGVDICTKAIGERAPKLDPPWGAVKATMVS